MNETLHIVYATDRRYLFPTQVAASSAVAWASRRENICIDILDCGVPDQDWERFSCEMRSKLGNMFGLVRHIVDIAKFNDYPSWHHSKGLYARFEIPRFLKDADWCVYCDGDTLFTDDPLKLENFFDNRYALWGHKDDFTDKQRRWHEAHQLPFEADQRLCSGFLLMNLKWFRENNGAERCLEFVGDYADVVYPDQDALNYVCLNKIGILPDEWGKFTYLADLETQRGCFHYVSNRPWELSQKSRLKIDSTQRIWFMAMARIVGRHPWRCQKPFAVYVWQCFKTRLWLGLYLLANRLPFLRGRYNGIYKNFWPRRKELEFAPVINRQ